MCHPIDDIVVGHRYRQDLRDMDALAASIREVGLLHPVVATLEGVLVAGARQLEACRRLGMTRVPVTVVELAEVARGQVTSHGCPRPTRHLRPVTSSRCCQGTATGAPVATVASRSGPASPCRGSIDMHFVQLTVDMAAALDHAEKAEGLGRHLRQDTGLVIKTLLTGAFAGPILRPWRLHAMHGRAALLIGYADEDADALRARLARALPSAQTAVGEIVTAPVPSLTNNAELAFEVRFSPVVSVNHGGGGVIRRDAFLRAKELAVANGDEAPMRDAVYRAYLAARLQGLELVSAALTGHRLERHAREGGGRWTVKSVPVAEMRGLVRVKDAALAQRTIREGVGRSKAYGCGMIRIAPGSAARAAA